VRYTVVLMPRAKRQARHISAWWCTQRPEAAKQFEEDLDKLLSSLTEHPNRGLARPTGSQHHRVLFTRRTRHRVVYRVRSRVARVEVLAILPP